MGYKSKQPAQHQQRTKALKPVTACERKTHCDEQAGAFRVLTEGFKGT